MIPREKLSHLKHDPYDSANDPVLTTEVFQPEEAKRLVESSDLNFRNLNHKEAENIAAVAARDGWEPNGQTVAFNPDGVLIDGQTRMWACWRSGVPLRTAVARGVRYDFHTDGGRKRTAGQLLSNLNIKHGNHKATACRWFLRLTHASPGRPPATGHKMRSSEAVDMVRSMPGLMEQVDRWAGMREYASVGMASSVMYIAGQEGDPRNLREAFAAGIETGAGLTVGHPCLAYRDRILRIRGGAERVPEIEQAALFISAWNRLVQGKTFKKSGLRYHSDGAGEKVFPSILPARGN